MVFLEVEKHQGTAGCTQLHAVTPCWSVTICLNPSQVEVSSALPFRRLFFNFLTLLRRLPTAHQPKPSTRLTGACGRRQEARASQNWNLLCKCSWENGPFGEPTQLHTGRNQVWIVLEPQLVFSRVLWRAAQELEYWGDTMTFQQHRSTLHQVQDYGKFLQGWHVRNDGMDRCNIKIRLWSLYWECEFVKQMNTVWLGSRRASIKKESCAAGSI